MIDECRDSLFFVEVAPLWLIAPADPTPSSQQDEIPSMSVPMVKLALLRKLNRYRSMDDDDDDDRLGIHWDKHGSHCGPTDSDHRNKVICSGSIISLSKPRWVQSIQTNRVIPVIYMPSEDPTRLHFIPCWIVGYSFRESPNALLTESTLVRILPTMQAVSLTDGSISIAENETLRFASGFWRANFTGETREAKLRESFKSRLLGIQNPQAVEELRRRLSLLLSRSISIGTTADALELKRKRSIRRRTLRNNLAAEYGEMMTELELPIIENETRGMHEGALTMHSPHHGSGKTLLVKAICEEIGAAVHLLQPGPFLAKYGIHADAALESVLHSIVMSAAVRNESICIILDHLDAFLPPNFSSGTASGDAALPVLNAIASFLKSLTGSFKSKGEFPFPSKNALFNLLGSNGVCLRVHVCIVGIITCQDREQPKEIERSQSSVFGALVGGRYRLPDLLASTRLVAFRKAFEDECLVLSPLANLRLPVFAASAVSIRGEAFEKVAKHLRRIVSVRGDGALVQVDDFGKAVECFQGGSTDSEISFLANKVCIPSNERNIDSFSSVGGNSEAKSILEEALALDPVKRAMLWRFGLLPPAGVLLFGPPGTGKTLLAKAVAKILRSQSGDEFSIGGAFISLQASEIVQAEIGTSEKKLVAAFETARNNAPSVVFIDEFQALFTDRSGSGSGKLASTLLQCLDDINRWAVIDDDTWNKMEGANYAVNRVVVLGATNTPWMIDKAFLRAGRFDKTVYVGLPSREDRAGILRIHISKMSLQLLDDDKENAISTLCSELSLETQGFSGADLAALCRAAAVRSLRDSKHGGQKVTMLHFLSAIDEDIVPSCSTSLVDKLRHWRP